MCLLINKRFAILLLIILLKGFALYAQDIFDASRKGNVERIKELIKINPDTINSINEAGFPPIILAIFSAIMV